MTIEISFEEFFKIKSEDIPLFYENKPEQKFLNGIKITSFQFYGKGKGFVQTEFSVNLVPVTKKTIIQLQINPAILPKIEKILKRSF